LAKNVPKVAKDSESESEDEAPPKKEDKPVEKDPEGLMKLKLQESDAEKQKLQEELKKKAEENLCIVCEENTISVVLYPW
jgi:hypothetical protein